MATTWTDLLSYVRVRWEIFDQTRDTVRFHLPTTQDRTQRVAVHHVQPDGESGPEWILIESAVARADDIDPRRLLELAGQSMVGGVVVAGGVALYRHAVSLGELRLEEFHLPFLTVAARADELEHQLTGADRF